MRTIEEAFVSQVARLLCEKFFRDYTRKQWDREQSQLDASVTPQLPARNNRNARYFTNSFRV